MHLIFFRKSFPVFGFIFFLFSESYCQPAIQIKYESFPLDYKPVSTFNYSYSMKPGQLAMITNDSFAFVYRFNSIYNTSFNLKKPGEKIIHGSLFYDFNRGEKLYEGNWPKGNKHLLIDSVVSRHWQLLDRHKKILKRSCQAALSVTGKNDSVIVWFTTELAFKKGPLGYDSIPGIVLEVFDQKTNRHIKATKIKNKKTAIYFPQGAVKSSSSEWRQPCECNH